MQISRNINRLIVYSLGVFLFWVLLCGMADCPKTLAMPGNHMLVSRSDTTAYMIVDVPPKFKHGSSQAWISRNTHYPLEAQRRRIQGTVFVSFVIDQEGKVGDIKVVKGVDPLLDEEAVRVVTGMPDWVPGSLKGRVVKVCYTLPIAFRLSQPSVSNNQTKLKVLASTEYYDGYMQILAGQEQKLRGIRPWTDDEKASVGSKKSALFKGIEDNSQAYAAMLDWVKKRSASFQKEMLLIVKNLGLSKEAQKQLLRIYKKEEKARIKFVKSIGEKDFIQKYKDRSIFEEMSFDIRSRCEVRETLSPGDHKRYVEAVYAKEMRELQSRASSMKDAVSYHALEQKPVFPEGNPALWIGRQVKYPPESLIRKSQGKVFVDFIIDTEGIVTDAKVLRSSGDDYLDREALRVINLMPRWTPGYKDGKPVKTFHSLPVSFQLK